MLDIINTIQETKLRRKITPRNALYYEVLRIATEMGKSRAEVDKELNELFEAGKIEIENSINDKIIIVI